jgi:uncharacterized protein YqfB (UPF0267 family)
MKLRICFSILFFSIAFLSRAQEISANVVVSAPGISAVNKSVINTLQRSVTEFINTTRWTDKVFEKNERIKANFYLIVKEYENNKFVCELNVSAVRPVYNSSYETTTLALSDKNVTFEYLEYQPLTFNPDNLDNNLTAVLAFYAYMIIGYDFDSFKMNAGKPYFQKAKEIQVTAAGQSMPGWDDTGKFFSRAKWVDQLLLPANIMFHKAVYTYHRMGLDLMADNPKNGKTNVIRAIQYLEKVNKKNGDLIIKIFFDTKSGEIVSVLSDGPETLNQKSIYDVLMNLAPMYRMKWDKIK